ncbi:hypothetical protein VST7929_02747 [Vibrio stylophorae]|uniref:EamA domain-containing protein n=1 Tax=Vibrio stylophorae TaxID=659351 RepID=A0ABN8DVF2_9VIBR|nr:DMT family transporter [Vibrio stylophorae]CAH0535086.1 hypothetical protein VST7929_02747 [Vibrio stylophorae]
MNFLLPLITVSLWAGNGIVNKLAAPIIAPGAIAFYRWFVALVILLPFCAYGVYRQWAVIKQWLPKLFCLSLLGMVFNQSFGYWAGHYTSATNMALITSMVPLFSLFFSVFLLNQAITMPALLGTLCSLFGVGVMVSQGNWSNLMAQGMNVGDGLMILASLSYGLYCVLLRRWQMPFGNWMMVFLQGTAAVVMLSPLWWLSDDTIPSQQAMPLIAYAAIAASVIAPWCWMKAINQVGVTQAAMYMNLMPIITAVLAAYTLNEELQRYHYVGGLLVIGGVLMLQQQERLMRRMARIWLAGKTKMGQEAEPPHEPQQAPVMADASVDKQAAMPTAKTV